MSTTPIQVMLDRSWFYANPEAYLSRPDFKRFEEISGLSLQDIMSEDRETVQCAQKKLEDQGVIFNEIRRQHFGFAFPYIVYTHTFQDFEAVPNHNLELDKFIMGFDMCDSLRRRHIALSYGVIPYSLEMVHRKTGRALTVKNLGSGVGLDVIHGAKNQNGRVGKVVNYDTNRSAIKLGQQIVAFLEKQTDELRPGVIQYVEKSMTKSDEPADVIVMVGVICGLQDFAAQYLLTQAHDQLNEGGALVVSSSNHHMEKTDPLASFLIQHVGAKEDASRSWSLNFRTKEKMEQLLRDAGFTQFEIFSDTEFPGKEALPEEILYGVDTLPARALGYDHGGKPLNLPPREVLERGVPYNWIAVATK